jgi:hypothetical protein
VSISFVSIGSIAIGSPSLLYPMAVYTVNFTPSAVISHNVMTALKPLALPADLLTARPKRLRFLLFNTPGRLVHHARRTVLRLATTAQRIMEWLEAARLLPIMVCPRLRDSPTGPGLIDGFAGPFSPKRRDFASGRQQSVTECPASSLKFRRTGPDEAGSTLESRSELRYPPPHPRAATLSTDWGVFAQTTWDKKGFPIRDPDSTTYTGAIETAEEFGKRIYLEAWKRGWSRAQKKVVMGDGAEWIWNHAEQHFPDAVQIVDLYRSSEHRWELVRKLHPLDGIAQKAWIKVHQRRLLDKGKIEKLLCALRSIDSTNPEVVEKLRTEADYFERNAERMRYPKFRRQHLF